MTHNRSDITIRAHRHISHSYLKFKLVHKGIRRASLASVYVFEYSLTRHPLTILIRHKTKLVYINNVPMVFTSGSDLSTEATQYSPQPVKRFSEYQNYLHSLCCPVSL